MVLVLGGHDQRSAVGCLGDTGNLGGDGTGLTSGNGLPGGWGGARDTEGGCACTSGPQGSAAGWWWLLVGGVGAADVAGADHDGVERMVTAGYAEFRPLDPADNDEAYAKNRRIEFSLIQ